MPFLAASKLMGEGISYSAEGDPCGAAAGIIANQIGGNSTLSEMFSMDFDKNCVMMRHMGELNISMARKDRRIRVIRKKFNLTEKLYPLTPVFTLEPGEAGHPPLWPHPLDHHRSCYFTWAPQRPASCDCEATHSVGHHPQPSSTAAGAAALPTPRERQQRAAAQPDTRAPPDWLPRQSPSQLHYTRRA